MKNIDYTLPTAEEKAQGLEAFRNWRKAQKSRNKYSEEDLLAAFMAAREREFPENVADSPENDHLRVWKHSFRTFLQDLKNFKYKKDENPNK